MKQLSLRAQRGNLVAAAMVVCRRVLNLNEIATWFDRLTGCARVLNLNEIATWFDRLTMSGCALRNEGALRISPSPQPSPIEGEGEGTGFYLDGQDEPDGQDFWVLRVAGLPRPSTGSG